MRYLFWVLVLALCCGGCGVPSGGSAGDSKSEDPVESFKILAKKIKEAHKDGLTIEKPYCNQQINIQPDMDSWKYDVKKNDSLVSPLIAKIVCYGQVKSKLIDNPFANMRFRAVYLYQNKHWTYSSCEVQVKDTDGTWCGLGNTVWPHDAKGESPLGYKLMDIDEIN